MINGCLRCVKTQRPHLGAQRLAPFQFSAASRLIAELHSDSATQGNWVFLAAHVRRLSLIVCVQRPNNYIWQDMSIIRGIHQKICIAPSYFVSSLFRFWYYILIFLAVQCKEEIWWEKNPSPLICSARSQLYRFPLKLYLRKTGRMWTLIFPTRCNTWSRVAREHIAVQCLMCVCSLQMALIFSTLTARLSTESPSLGSFGISSTHWLKFIGKLPSQMEYLHC